MEFEPGGGQNETSGRELGTRPKDEEERWKTGVLTEEHLLRTTIEEHKGLLFAGDLGDDLYPVNRERLQFWKPVPEPTA